MGLNIVVWILGFVIAVRFLALGIRKLVQETRTIQRRDHLGIAPTIHRMMGGAEAVGAIGLVVGSVAGGDAGWIGFVAAVVLLGLSVGLMVIQGRSGDSINELTPTIVAGLLCLSYLLAATTRYHNDAAGRISAILGS